MERELAVGTGIIIFLVLLILALVLLASCVKIVPQAHALVIERLGAYQGSSSVSERIWIRGRSASILRCRSSTAWQGASF